MSNEPKIDARILDKVAELRDLLHLLGMERSDAFRMAVKTIAAIVKFDLPVKLGPDQPVDKNERRV